MPKSKAEIRKQMLNQRGEITSDERIECARRLVSVMSCYSEYIECSEVLLYASYGSELGTYFLIEDAFMRNKKVYLPKVINNGCMDFFAIDSIDSLVQGYRGIPEPVNTKAVFEYSAKRCKNALLIMPGVAFDHERNRLGYGRGFYDRYLSDKPCLQHKSIGVGYDMQIIESIPCEPTDIKPAKIISI